MNRFRVDIITLFPDFFSSPCATGLLGKAIREQRVLLNFINPRDWAQDRHRTVDDTPCGGGAGMVMQIGPLSRAIQFARCTFKTPVIMMSPQGRPLEQPDLSHWAKLDHIILLAGRYEGFDERVRTLVDDEVSLGDFVLTGGEYAALALLDGVVRLLPGTLGNQASHEGDSFSDGLLEYPQYTRPIEWNGLKVPDVLLSGHHAQIKVWRHQQQLMRTRKRRPDLLKNLEIVPKDRKKLAELNVQHPQLYFILGFEVSDEQRRQLSYLASAYQLSSVLLFSSSDSLIEEDGNQGVVRRVTDPAELSALIPDDVVKVSYQAKSDGNPLMDYKQARRWRASNGLCVVIGDSKVFSEIPWAFAGRLPIIRSAELNNYMDSTTLTAILVDRLLGEGF